MPLAAHCSLIKQAAFLKGVDTLLADYSLTRYWQTFVKPLLKVAPRKGNNKCTIEDGSAV